MLEFFFNNETEAEKIIKRGGCVLRPTALYE